ncbi:MAG TPA: hypothetical protein VIY30_06580 [Burkholderiaceae bacterium]
MQHAELWLARAQQRDQNAKPGNAGGEIRCAVQRIDHPGELAAAQIAAGLLGNDRVRRMPMPDRPHDGLLRRQVGRGDHVAQV